MCLPTAGFEDSLRRLALAWLLLFYLAFALVVWPGDAAIAGWMAHSAWIAQWQGVWKILTDYGMYPFYLLFLGVLLAGWQHPRLRRLALGYWLAQFIASVILVRLIKTSLGRARPDAGNFPGQAIEWMIGPTLNSSFHSFVSGHTTDLFVSALFTALLCRRPWATALALGFACLIAFTRLALHKHYMSDVAGGLFVAGVVAFALARWATRPLAFNPMPQIPGK